MHIQVYIIHSTLLEIRKQKMSTLTDILEKSEHAKFDVEYITEFDSNAIKDTDIKDFISLSKKNDGEIYDFLVKNLHLNQASNVIKHAVAIKKASESMADFCLILEDDVLHADEVDTKLVDICNKMTDEMDLMFLGLPSLSPITESEIKKTSEFYKMFPSCDSYIAKPHIFGKMKAGMYPIRHVANIMLSYVTSTQGISTYMTVPNIFLDGSKYGTYLSAVDPNNHLIYNPDLGKLVMKIQDIDCFSQEIEDEFENIKFKNHPDVMHLNATYHIKKKDYKKAEAILENCLNVVQQNGCIVNSETDILKSYIRLHRYLQV
jgi:hypothetical protein